MTATGALDAELMRKEFSHAKRAWCRFVFVQCGLVAIPIVVALVDGKLAAYIGGILALGGTVVQFFCRRSADEAYQRAERARRAYQLSEAIGRDLSAVDTMTVLAEATQTCSADPTPVGEYYNNDLPRGARRLASMLWESAYCTTQLAAATAEDLAAVAVIGVTTVVTTLIGCLWLGSGSAVAVTVATCGSSMIGLFGFGTFAELWRKYGGLARVARDTCLRCEGLLARPSLALADVLPTLVSYDVALACAAPIPSYIWRSRQKSLARSWDGAQLARGANAQVQA